MPDTDTGVAQTPAQSTIASWLEKKFAAVSRGRWAEEREWFQAGMFDQLKQWLESSGVDNKRLKPMDSKGKKWPMPVTNHFSKTIATNANALGAEIPQMLGKSDNYDAKNRRAAEAAENAIDAANTESGMNILNPILARQIVLWGLGITKDTVIRSQHRRSAGRADAATDTWTGWTAGPAAAAGCRDRTGALGADQDRIAYCVRNLSAARLSGCESCRNRD